MTLRFEAPVLLLGHGPVDRASLDAALQRCPHIVAADGGADHAAAFGLRLEAVIGDLDSAETLEDWRAKGVTVIADRDQNTTDFEKALGQISAPRILALGFSGGRADHYLANASRLVRDGRSDVVVLDGVDCALACPENLRITLPPECRISFYPFAPVQARSTGLRWPLDGLDLTPLGQIATSNAATGPVEIRGGAGLWVIMPAAQLGALWPAPPAAL